MLEWINVISTWAIPVVIVLIPTYALSRRVPVYESFIDGAKDGFDTAVRIIPHLVGMMASISIFRASGALDALIGALGPLLSRLGVPPEVLPLGLLRPITGSGSLAYAADLMQRHGPDSLIGRIASTIQGSTDTTLYVLIVYFGAVGIRRSKYALKVGLFSDLVGFVAAIAVCLLLF